MHDRFNREVWAFKHDFTGALAKWLVKQSSYTVPDNLEICILKFNDAISAEFEFDKLGMVKISLRTTTARIYKIFESIPEIMALNESKNPHEGNIQFTSRYDAPPHPDDDFIDIMAVAQNITCEFATEADSKEFLE